jgi:hypothetical protein
MMQKRIPVEVRPNAADKPNVLFSEVCVKSVLGLCLFLMAMPINALDGQVGIHDPSTVIRCNGKLYTYGTEAPR